MEHRGRLVLSVRGEAHAIKFSAATHPETGAQCPSLLSGHSCHSRSMSSLRNSENTECLIATIKNREGHSTWTSNPKIAL